MKKLAYGLLLIMFLIGCSGTDDTTTTTSSVFQSGTQGLVAAFEPFGVLENGVYTIFDTEGFPIEVLLKNKGEEDVPVGAAKVSLKGINLNDFAGIAGASLTNPHEIEKTSESLAEGGEDRVDFTPSQDAKYNVNVTGFYQPDIFATVEYLYKTHLLIPAACFKEDLQDDRVCIVEGAKTFYVSGAPITVTAVEESAAGKGIMLLKITVENVGGGRVALPTSDFDSRSLGGQLSFTMATNPEKWECRSSGNAGESRLVDGKATITCKLKEPLAKGDLYTQQVELELSYKYQSLIQQTVKIVESSR